MSSTRSISLIDLSTQLTFEIDDVTKEKLCFGETLIVSCCHCEGDPLESESSWSIQSTISSLVESSATEEDKTIEEEEVKEVEKEEVKEPVDLDIAENDFHFFFYDDLHKRPPAPLDKDVSVVVVNKLPEINPRRRTGVCLCRSDDEFEPKCKCWTTICTCGAKTTRTCTCGAVVNICVCHPENEPSPICDCGQKEICVCHQDNKPRPFCTCDKHEPCLCHPHVHPVCTCGGSNPCLCHPMRGETVCTCGKGVKCSCTKDKPEPTCICSKTEVCFCHPDNMMRRVCTCGFPDACLCDSKGDMKPICVCDAPDACTCHSDLVLRPICTCNNPEACLCDPEVPVKRVCVCANSKACLCFDDKVLDVCICSSKPCLCHKGEIREDCVCDEFPPVEEEEEVPEICTCKRSKPKKKKTKMEGYVECSHDDSHHIFFDYAYGIHEKFDKPPKVPEKLLIKGLYDKIEGSPSCPIHDRPKYQTRKPRQFCLDCCSSTGGITITISTLGADKDRFLVQVISKFTKQGAKYSTKLTSIVDCNLHTLEESRNEHLIKVDSTKERSHYMAICICGYYNKITQISGEKKKIKRLYHTFEAAHDFILEGSNLVLLRYMALKRYKGQVKTKSVLMVGTICECVYISHGTSQAIVNGKPIFVLKIDRQIIEPCGIMYEARIVMSLKGRLIFQEWTDSNYVIHVNPLLNVDVKTDSIEDAQPLRERWRDDMQLFSDFLEFKSAKKSEHEQFLIECEPLQSVIKDYLEALVLLRPTDALHFTRHYFGNAISSLDLPHNEYFDQCQRRVRYYDYED